MVHGTKKPPMKLVYTDRSYTEDARKCAGMLNDFFGSQLFAQHQLNADKISTLSYLKSPLE